VPFLAEPIQLSEQQRTDLNEIAQLRSLPAGFVFRAKLILMLAEGASFAVIKERLQTTAPTISRWKQRFLEDGLEGLHTYHPGQPAVILTPALRAKILAATRRKPKDGSTHWSCRKLAAAINVSKDMVHRVWQEAGLKPHRLKAVPGQRRSGLRDESRRCDRAVSESTAARSRVLCGRKDSDSGAGSFGPGAAAVSGPRRAPRVRVLPAWHAVAVRGTRHQDGARARKNGGAPHQRRLRGFLGEVVSQCRPRQEIHIILDNLSAHKTQAVRDFLDTHPKVRLHFTPTYSSWLNQVELWFAKIERDIIARGVFTSVPDLARKLRRYINAYSANAQPIRWKYSDVTRRIRSNDLVATVH